MTTKDKVITTLQRERDQLLARWPIASLALFGSVARGDQGPNSDVDILVAFNGPIGWEIVDLAEELEALLGVKVDLIPRQGLKPRYWERIAPEVLEVIHV
jgi:predicted nucleotidyltransferase